MFKRLIVFILCIIFCISNLENLHAQDFDINQLPFPGSMIGQSEPFSPMTLKGLVINPQRPLEFQFLIDTGRDPQDSASVKEEADRLIKYFMAGLTIPEGELWVNLSPYEKNRITTPALGQTQLGRDLLAQDYILKQLTASLIYPEKDLGKEFWNKIYAQTQAQFGTTEVPVNTFNKVWILPDQAQVYENGKGAYITKATLKVMLDEDYLAKKKHQTLQTASLSSQIVRQIVIPEITKEVNTGKNFARLRQIYNAMILSKWYKETITNGLLESVYTNKDKTGGIILPDPSIKEQIYQRYIQAYKRGVFNFIKEDYNSEGQVVPRKYFSGGFTEMGMTLDRTGKAGVLETDGAMLSLKVVFNAAIKKMRNLGRSLTYRSQQSGKDGQEIAQVRKLNILPIGDVKKLFQEATAVEPTDQNIASVVGWKSRSKWYTAVKHTLDAVLGHPITVYYPGPAADIIWPLKNTDGDIFLFVDIGEPHGLTLNSALFQIGLKITAIGGRVINKKKISDARAEIDFKYEGKLKKLIYFHKIDASNPDTLPQPIKDGFDVYVEKALRTGYGVVNSDKVLGTALPYLRNGGFLLTDYDLSSVLKDARFITVGKVHDTGAITSNGENFLTYFVNAASPKVEDAVPSQNVSQITPQMVSTRRNRMNQVLSQNNFELVPNTDTRYMSKFGVLATVLSASNISEVEKRSLLERKETKEILARDLTTGKATGSIFGVYVKSIAGEEAGQIGPFVNSTFFEVYRSVNRRNRNSGLKWVLRMKLMQEAIQAGFSYYVITQNDSFSEKDLVTEIQKQYTIDARLIYLKRGLPNGQQYVVFELPKHKEPSKPLDRAQLSTPGGVDFNGIALNSVTQNISVQFNSSQIKEFQEGNFEGFTPIIISITRITSLPSNIESVLK